MPPRADQDPAAPLRRCAAGELPANVALMQLFQRVASEAEARRLLRGALRRAGPDGASRLRSALDLWRQSPAAFRTVRAVLEAEPHSGGPPACAAAFDRAVLRSPEASVALYSLGRADLLQAATAEIVGAMRQSGLLRPDRRVLDLGCGIGRFVAALAPAAGLVVGVDISAGMLDAARRRCAALHNVALLRGSGLDLAPFRDGVFDIVLAADVLPYMVQAGAGLPGRHFAEARRVLRTGGRLLVLNYSYRGDDDLDRAEVAGLAADAGFTVRRSGTRGFRLWDGLAFDLQKR